MGFDFENTEAYQPGLSTLLPVGNHLVTLSNPTSGESSGGYPQLEVEGSNASGSRKAWLVYGQGTNGPFGVRDVVGLFQAAGLTLSNADQDENGVITQRAADRLDGKQVLMIVREEEDRMNPGQKRIRVKGFRPASDAAEVPIDTAGLPEPQAPSKELSKLLASLAAAAPSPAPEIADDDIPF